MVARKGGNIGRNFIDRLIWQQESDNCHSQSLGLAERSAEQHNATRFLRDYLHGISCTGGMHYSYAYILYSIFAPKIVFAAVIAIGLHLLC